MAQIRISPAALLGANDFSAQQRVPDGTEGAPSWSFTSETDTGVFLSAANVLGFATAGAERWTINASGHLLATDTGTYDIGASGATSPRDLHLTRNITLGGVIAAPDGLATAPVFTNTGDTNTGIYFPSDEQMGVTVTGVLRLNITAAGIFSAVSLGATTDGGVNLGIASFRFGDLNLSGAANIGGALNHDGTTAGVYGVTPATRPTAFTQTYATATKTHSNPNQSAISDSSGGTPSNTLALLPALTDSPITADALRDNLQSAWLPVLQDWAASLVEELNFARLDVLNAKQVLNQVIDDLQITGWLQ